MGTRRKGREAALQLLYQIELSADSSVDARATYWEGRAEADPAVRDFAEELVSAVLERTAEIDGVIDSAASNWQLGRIARLDLSLLRLAVCELLYLQQVPAEVAVNEAIDIARKYSDAAAPAFINGVLDRVARERGLFGEA